MFNPMQVMVNKAVEKSLDGFKDEMIGLLSKKSQQHNKYMQESLNRNIKLVTKEYLATEEFIDSIIARIKSKQLPL
jgi:hypothetical protein